MKKCPLSLPILFQPTKNITNQTRLFKFHMYNNTIYLLFLGHLPLIAFLLRLMLIFKRLPAFFLQRKRVLNPACMFYFKLIAINYILFIAHLNTLLPI